VFLRDPMSLVKLIIDNISLVRARKVERQSFVACSCKVGNVPSAELSSKRNQVLTRKLTIETRPAQ
jgi:hypothetical protein